MNDGPGRSASESGPASAGGAAPAAVQALLDMAEQLEQAGQRAAALATYRQALALLVNQPVAGTATRVGTLTTQLAPQFQPVWQEHRSAHLRLLFQPDTFAATSAPTVAARLEKMCDAIVTALALDDQPAEPLTIVLAETLDLAPGGPARRDEQAIVRSGQIWAVFRPDSPGPALERALTSALLTTAGPTAEATFLIDGLLGHATQQIDNVDPARLAATLVEQSRLGHRLALADAVHGPTADTAALYYQTATAFVGYLLTTHGPEAFRRFAAAFDPAAPDIAVEAAYDRPLVVLEQAWLESLRASQPAPMTVSALLRRIGRFLRPYWPRVTLVVLAIMSTVAFTLVQPLSFSLIIDRAITPGDYLVLALIVAFLLVFFVVQSLLSLGGEYVNQRVGERVMADIRLTLFGHLQRLPMGFYARAQVGDLMSRLSSDLWTLQYAITGVLVQATYLVLTLISSAILIVLLDWRLALLALLALPLFVIGPRLFGKRAAAASYERQEHEAAAASVAQENLGAQTVIKAFGLQDLQIATYREHVERLGRSAVRATFLATLMGTTSELSMSFINLMALAVGAVLVMQGHLSVGLLVAFTGLLGSVLVPVQQLSNIYEGLQQATGGMQRIDEILAEEARVVDAPDAPALARFSQAIRFEDVTFSYTGEQANLQRLNLTIHAGQSVAIVGPSGCGKSTTLGLLLRFYDPTAGRVTLDGHDLRQVTQASVRAQIGTVLQDTVLFNTSVRENIRLGRPEATDADVEAAARAAEIHDFITSLPDGYDTVAGERGARLSGGQRQRLAIARAVLRDAPILLLDEATSALDPQTEAAINATLRRLSVGRTVISVTHRLASVVQADQIIVLDRGRLAEAGAHADLLAGGGLYAHLWEQQHGFVAGDDARPTGVEPERLRAMPLFRDLDSELLPLLASQFTAEPYSAGATVLREGEPGDRFYLIARGQVEVVTLGPTGEERRLAVLSDGESFGEMALLYGTPRSATVRARADCQLLALDRTAFQMLLLTAPSIREALTRQAAARGPDTPAT